ncbi:hypothetical protein EYR40_009993 [Pleurotus pulmonarius]|nr:hypothetical protein EYR40_009993 [Pleurotus pulmonarius]
MSTIDLLPNVTSFSIGVILMALSSVFAVIHRALERYRDPLRDVPGPFLARWTSLWLAYQVRMGRRYLVVDALHKKYGPLVRIAPNHVSVAHKDAINVVYGQGSRALDKSPYYHAFVSDKASIFSTVDRQEHAQKRRLVSQGFSYKSLMSVTPLLHSNLFHFVEKIDEISQRMGSIDVLQWFNFLAFDILSDLAFGEPIGMVTNESDIVTVMCADGKVKEENAISLVDEREHLAAVVGIHPWFKTLSKFIPDPFFIRGHKSSTGLVDLARRRVTKRLESGSYREDILNKLIETRIEESGALTPEQVTELIAETVTLLIAGSDTTSNSITAIIHLVLTHSRVHEKLLRHLQAAVPDGQVPKHEDVKDIPYLTAVIEEGLRYYATTAIGLHRSVPRDGVLCLGKFFPEGTEMSVPAYTIQHDRTIWGDPENFRPERWLEEKDLGRYLLTFGKGPRQCLGRNLAYIEMQLVIATMLLRYDIKLESDHLETTEGFMHKPLRMMVEVKRKSSGC